VGKRLALGALNLAYGEKDLVYSSPIFKSSTIEGQKIILSFNHVGKGLVSNDNEELRRFEIAGADKRFVWANAHIQDNTVIVQHENISRPQYVRYAWADNPLDVNLYNQEGLPASPFRNYDPEHENDQPWQGKKAAVVLTYDDALDVQLDNAIPLLDSLNLKATFYLSTFFDGFKNRIKDWKKASENGHELGNHTLYHPCNGTLPGREWVNPNYDLSTYTVGRMVDEVHMTNVLLKAVDGKTERTFAFTCGDMKIGDEFFINKLKNDFIAARAVRSEMHSINEIDLFNIDSYMLNGESGEQLIEIVKNSMESNKLLVFLFHGVGGGHGLDVSLSAHRELLNFLKQNDNKVWTTTLIDAVKNIKANQKN